MYLSSFQLPPGSQKSTNKRTKSTRSSITLHQRATVDWNGDAGTTTTRFTTPSAHVRSKWVFQCNPYIYSIYLIIIIIIIVVVICSHYYYSLFIIGVVYRIGDAIDRNILHNINIQYTIQVWYGTSQNSIDWKSTTVYCVLISDVLSVVSIYIWKAFDLRYTCCSFVQAKWIFCILCTDFHRQSTHNMYVCFQVALPFPSSIRVMCFRTQPASQHICCTHIRYDRKEKQSQDVRWVCIDWKICSDNSDARINNGKYEWIGGIILSHINAVQHST